MLIFAYTTETTESIPVKLEPRHTVILRRNASVLWSNFCAFWSVVKQAKGVAKCLLKQQTFFLLKLLTTGKAFKENLSRHFRPIFAAICLKFN